MLTITSEQFATLSRMVYLQFRDELATHCRQFSPDLCKTITSEELFAVIDGAMNTARKYRFSKRGPIRLVTEMTLIFGSSFDTDPQYPWIKSVLVNAQEKDELAVSWELYQATSHYLETVHGKDDRNVFNALRKLKLMAGDPGSWPTSASGFDLAQRFGHIFPEKAGFVGDEAVTDLISSSVDRCSQRYGFTSVNAQTLYCTLAFAFGHGFDRDPLYPWIIRTLTDHRLASPEQMTQRLHRKAITWLDHVLSEDLAP